jgi:hypothetical protein
MAEGRCLFMEYGSICASQTTPSQLHESTSSKNCSTVQFFKLIWPQADLATNNPMGKKKSKKQSRPWCWYCEKDFDDDKVLVTHQRVSIAYAPISDQYHSTYINCIQIDPAGRLNTSSATFAAKSLLQLVVWLFMLCKFTKLKLQSKILIYLANDGQHCIHLIILFFLPHHSEYPMLFQEETR